MLTSVMTKPAVPAKPSKRPLPLGKHHPLRKLGFQSAQVMTGAQLGDGKCQHGAPTHPELHRLLHLISKVAKTLRQRRSFRAHDPNRAVSGAGHDLGAIL